VTPANANRVLFFQCGMPSRYSGTQGPGRWPVRHLRCCYPNSSTQTACAKLGLSASDVTCVASRCVLGKSCDSRAVQCHSEPPACSAGQAPIVEGSYYSGSCIPVDQCSAVTSCSVCTAANLACVTDQINSVLGTEYHCVSVPANCVQNPTCQCMGGCEPYYQCANPNSTALVCQCPTC